VGCGDRVFGTASETRNLDSRHCDPRYDPANAKRVLGTDGDRHHGRLIDRNVFDADQLASLVRLVLSSQAAGGGEIDMSDGLMLTTTRPGDLDKEI